MRRGDQGRIADSPKRKIPKALVRSEHDEQVALFQWAEIAAGQHPELRLMFAIPNFSGRLGKVPPVAAMRQAQKLKAEGRKPGVPDVFLPVARNGVHGLFLEIKRENGRISDLSPEQDAWLDALGGEGYSAQVVYGFEAARDAILEHLTPR